METLSLVVNIDLERLVSVREEIERIKKELQTLNSNTTPPEVFQALEKELAKNTKEFRAFVVAVTQAGLELDNSFKKKLYDSSQSVDNLTDKIKAQESVIRDSEEEVRRLSEAYAEHGKLNTNGDQTVTELNAAKTALEGQKNTLVGLRQEQAESSSSVKQLNNEYSLFRQLTGGKAMSGQELFTAIQGIPGPVGQAASSLKMFTKESLAFIATHFLLLPLMGC